MFSPKTIAKSHHEGGFEKAWDKLTKDQQRLVEMEIRYECDWALTTFYTKYKGIRPVRKLEIPVVEAVFRKFNINPWTGETIITARIGIAAGNALVALGQAIKNKVAKSSSSLF